MLAVIYFGCGNAFGLWKSQNPVEKSLVCGKLFDLWKTFGSLKNVAKNMTYRARVGWRIFGLQMKN